MKTGRVDADSRMLELGFIKSKSGASGPGDRHMLVHWHEYLRVMVMLETGHTQSKFGVWPGDKHIHVQATHSSRTIQQMVNK